MSSRGLGIILARTGSAWFRVASSLEPPHGCSGLKKNNAQDRCFLPTGLGGLAGVDWCWLSLVASSSLARQEMRFVELEETTGEAILGIEPVLLLEKGIYVRISPAQIFDVHFAGVGEIERAAVLHGQARQALRERVAFCPTFSRERFVKIENSGEGFLARRVREKRLGVRLNVANR